MTLIDYFNQFWKLNDDKPFNPNDAYLYFYLLSLWNRTGRLDSFSVKTSSIEIETELNKKTILRSRERLRNKGLIEFKQGSTKGKHPYYILGRVTDGVTDCVTDCVTESKEKVSPIPPLKENITEFREKEKTTKVVSKKETDLSFCLPSYVPIMEEWLAFKKEKGQTYKPIGLRACYNNLLKLSDGNPTIARMIVDRSIANNWAGLFKLNNNGEQIQRSTASSFTSKQEANDYAFSQFVKYREARENGLLDEVEKPF